MSVGKLIFFPLMFRNQTFRRSELNMTDEEGTIGTNSSKRRLIMRLLFNISKLIVLLVLTTVIIAGCSSKTHRWGYDNAAERISKSLGLNEDQQAELDVLMEHMKNRGLELCPGRKAIGEEVMKQLESDSFDAEVVNSLIKAELEKVEKAIGDTVEEFAHFHSTLTPEQREKLIELIKEKKEKWGGRHHPGLCDQANK